MLLLPYSGDSFYLEQNTLEERNVLLSSPEQRAGMCFGCSLCRGAGSQGWPVQAGARWRHQEAWPHTKHPSASAEHCFAHFWGKHIQELLQVRKRHEFFCQRGLLHSLVKYEEHKYQSANEILPMGNQQQILVIKTPNCFGLLPESLAALNILYFLYFFLIK